MKQLQSDAAEISSAVKIPQMVHFSLAEQQFFKTFYSSFTSYCPVRDPFSTIHYPDKMETVRPGLSELIQFDMS